MSKLIFLLKNMEENFRIEDFEFQLRPISIKVSIRWILWKVPLLESKLYSWIHELEWPARRTSAQISGLVHISQAVDPRLE